MVTSTVLPVRDVVRAADYRRALGLLAGHLYDLARSPIEQSMTLHRRLDGEYNLYNGPPGDERSCTVKHLAPFIDDKQRVVSYPLVAAHNHPIIPYGINRTHSTEDIIDMLIPMTENVEDYVEGGRPLSIIVTLDGKDTFAEIVQAQKTSVRNPDEYMFVREPFRITPDHSFVHEKGIPLDIVLQYFES